MLLIIKNCLTFLYLKVLKVTTLATFGFSSLLPLLQSRGRYFQVAKKVCVYGSIRLSIIATFLKIITQFEFKR